MFTPENSIRLVLSNIAEHDQVREMLFNAYPKVYYSLIHNSKYPIMFVYGVKEVDKHAFEMMFKEYMYER